MDMKEGAIGAGENAVKDQRSSMERVNKRDAINHKRRKERSMATLNMAGAKGSAVSLTRSILMSNLMQVIERGREKIGMEEAAERLKIKPILSIFAEFVHGRSEGH